MRSQRSAATACWSKRCVPRAFNPGRTLFAAKARSFGITSDGVLPPEFFIHPRNLIGDQLGLSVGPEFTQESLDLMSHTVPLGSRRRPDQVSQGFSEMRFIF